MDKNIVVTKEGLPQRCEVCHQADMFVASTGYCERCKDTAITVIESINNTRRQLNEQNTRLANGLQRTSVIYSTILIVVFIYLLYLEPLYNFFSKILGNTVAGLLIAGIWFAFGILGVWLIDRSTKY